MPGNEVPTISSEIKQALKDRGFRHLKMSEHTFKCYLGLWRGININPPEDLYFPIPLLARMLPLKVATWNNLKGGGDNLTKLADICQEKNWRAFGQSDCLHQDSFEHWIGVSSLQSAVHVPGSVLLPNAIARQGCS